MVDLTMAPNRKPRAPFCNPEEPTASSNVAAATLPFRAPISDWRGQCHLPPLDPNGTTAVHIWTASLDLPPQQHTELGQLLCPAEQRRAERYHFEIHRRRFIAARGLLRTLLGQYLNTPPADIEFSYGPYGKPALAPAFAKEGLEFNLAHSEDLVLFVMAVGSAVGVDLEEVRALPEMEDLVRRFFSRREAALFAALPPAQKTQGFFNLWTRKEAWLKATGEGIAQYLSQVEVSFVPGQGAELLSLPTHLADGRRWQLYDLAAAGGFAGALAIAGPHSRPVCRKWNELVRSTPPREQK